MVVTEVVKSTDLTSVSTVGATDIGLQSVRKMGPRVEGSRRQTDWVVEDRTGTEEEGTIR